MARVRSPAYPALSLPDAVDMIRKVHALQQRTLEPRDVILRHMGYAGESGRSLKAISALIKYGFLEKGGDGDGLRVSERAMTVLYPEHYEDKLEALHASANEPTLFAEIFERWPDGRPSEDSLKAFLIRRGFNVNSVDAVARSFYDTYDLVSGHGGSYDSDGSKENYEPEDEPMSETLTYKPTTPVGAAVQKGLEFTSSRGGVVLNDTRPLFDFDSVTIQTRIDNRNDLEKLIYRLQQLEKMLPEKEGD